MTGPAAGLDHDRARRNATQLADTDTVSPGTHIAAPAMSAHGVVRVRCMWCGGLIFTAACDQEYGPAGVRAVIPAGRFVRVDSSGVFRVLDELPEEDDAPPNACTWPTLAGPQPERSID